MTRSDAIYVAAPPSPWSRAAVAVVPLIWAVAGAGSAAVLGAGMYAVGGVWSTECAGALTTPAIAGAAVGWAGAMLVRKPSVG